MAPSDRRRTPISSEASARASALEQLKALRQQGGRRVDGFQVKMEEKIYDTLAESDYNLLVAKRRQASKDFIVGDDGFGYNDVGEEEDWERDNCPDSDDDEERLADSKSKKAKSKTAEMKKEATNKKPSALAAAANLLGKQRVSSMFAAASTGAALRRTSPSLAKGPFSADNILEDVLADITVDEADRERERQRRRGIVPKRPTFSNVISVDTTLQSTSISKTPSSKLDIGFSENTGDGITSCNAGIVSCKQGAANMLFPDDLMVPPRSPGQKEAGGLEVMPQDEPEIACKEVEDARIVAKDKFLEGMKQYPSNEAEVPRKQDVEVRTGLNAKVTKKEVTAEQKAMAPWHASYEFNDTKIVKAENVEEAAVPEAVGSELPVESNGRSNFFLIDIYEEASGANPGTLFLFGKVNAGSCYENCCVIVYNMQRCIYAVPAPSVFPAIQIAELEEESKCGDPVKRVKCMKKLQEMATELKAELAHKLLDMNVETFRMSPVKRSYAFENADVPTGEHYFLKLSYAFKDAPLPADMKGVHFSALLGTHTSALEIFLIKRKIRGPTWLIVKNPKDCTGSSQVSWCKMELSVDSPKDILVASPGELPRRPPPLIVAALNLKTVINHKQNVNEIVSASVVYCQKVKIDMPMPQTEWNTREMLSHFSILRKLDGGIFPVGFNLEVAQINSKAGSNVLSLESSERALLNHLMIKMHQLDPDVLVGHNISGFDLDVLLHRMQACKIQSNMWSKVGRLKRSTMPRLTGGGTIFGAGAAQGALACIAGRLLCDTYIASRDLLKEVSYALSELAKSQLGRERRELMPTDIPDMYKESKSLAEMIECGETDAWLTLALMFRLSILPLTRQLTNISGNLWGKTIQGARAQRVEYLLLHEFHARKFILPDKLTARDKENVMHKRKLEDDGDDQSRDEAIEGPIGKRKKGPSYSGGLVLEPKKGLYDKFVLLLDFNSLYPSIIQEYNVCFTTVQRTSNGSIPSLPSTDIPGVLPQILKNLVERRRQVKKWLKQTQDPLKYQQLDIQQQALKLSANSMYGCLGFSNSRFYAKPLAELITSQGRDILQNTVDLVQNSLNLEVIYGDTDSIMIHTGTDDLQTVKLIAVKTIKEVNKKYKLLEIDLDGIFKRMLLLKKKKYAAVKLQANSDGSYREVIEQKGLDIVRRDWSLISKEIGNFCLEQILSGGTCEDVVETIHSQLRKLQEDMRNGQIELDKYVITKTLTKAPEAYPDAKNQPHVQVALRLKKAGHRIGCSVGDTVPYIICCEQGSSGASSASIAERARHPDELKHNPGNWLVDIDYYLSQQVHPVVARLCSPIEGTDAARLANCLGLDSSKFQAKPCSTVVEKDEAMISSSGILDDDERYRHCDPLRLICPSCSTWYEFLGISHIISTMVHDSPPDGSGNDATPEDYIQCAKCRSIDGAPRISASALANQVKQRAEEFIGRYYDGWMVCDDEMCGHTTRCLNLRILGDLERGTICPNYPRCNGHLVRQYTEVDLYKQLTHFCRLLDVECGLEKVSEIAARVALEKKLSGLKKAMDLATQIVKDLQNRCAYKWVRMDSLCVSIT